MKKKLTLVAGLLFVLILGFFMGVWITGRNYQRFVIDPARNQMANVPAMHVDILSLLRIGATEDAVNTLEGMVDNATLALTHKTNNPEELPPEVVRALKQIKTYREIHPPENERVAEALAKVPQVTDYKKECQAGICRLLEYKKQEAQQSAEADKAAQP